jgi:phosphatidylglycerophosphatase A
MRPALETAGVCARTCQMINQSKNFSPAEFVATGLYSGYTPKSPGTAGSLALLIIWYVAHWALGESPLWFDIFAATLMSLGGWYATRCFLLTKRAADPHKPNDPPCVVADEFAGMLIALVGVSPEAPGKVFAAFVLFRFFDILKPGPVRWLERLPGAVGIMADDILAGILAAAVLLFVDNYTAALRCAFRVILS